MMIAFSTQPGNVALDGQGRNSPFTDALLRHIATEGASINDMMIDVRNDVLKATDGKQVPWENSSLTGQFFFKPAAPQAGADTASGTAAELAALRQEIDRLQADQGAMLAAQQEQLKALQQKLAAASGTAAPPSPSQTPTAPSRVITVEPAGSPAPDAVAASTAGPNPAQTPAAKAETVASAETAPLETKPAAPAAEPAPLPEDASGRQLASDIVAALKTLDCYQGEIAGSWGQPSQDALKRFNDLSKLDLALDQPEQATLDALKDWKGAHCTIQAVATPDATTSKAAAPPTTKQSKKAVAKPVVKTPKAVARQTAPRPKVDSGTSGQGGGEAQQELQRAFPSTNWPGGH